MLIGIIVCTHSIENEITTRQNGSNRVLGKNKKTVSSGSIRGNERGEKKLYHSHFCTRKIDPTHINTRARERTCIIHETRKPSIKQSLILVSATSQFICLYTYSYIKIIIVTTIYR